MESALVQRMDRKALLVAPKRQEKGKRRAFELPQVAATTLDELLLGAEIRQVIGGLEIAAVTC
jgi:hypothetical protein